MREFLTIWWAFCTGFNAVFGVMAILVGHRWWVFACLWVLSLAMFIRSGNKLWGNK